MNGVGRGGVGSDGGGMHGAGVGGPVMSGFGTVLPGAGEGNAGFAVPSLWTAMAGVALALCLTMALTALRRDRRHRLRSAALLGGEARRAGPRRSGPYRGGRYRGRRLGGGPCPGDGPVRWRRWAWAGRRRPGAAPGRGPALGPGRGPEPGPVFRGGRGAVSGAGRAGGPGGATGARGDGAHGGGWPEPGRDRRLRPLRDGGLSLAVGLLGPLLLGGVAGVLVGIGAGCATGFLLGRRATTAPAPGPQADERVAAEQVPLAAELLAACLAAGSGPGEAAGAVGGSLGGPLGERLRRASAELRLGGDPAEVWGRFGGLPGTRTLARRMERAGISGVPTVEAMARLAANQRSQRTRWAQERARRAAVLVTGPLGLCFLPAFLVVGVVPVVIGLAGALL